LHPEILQRDLPLADCQSDLSVSSRQPINQRWHRIIGQMIQKLADRVNSFPTGRAPGHDNAFSALRD